MVLHKLRLFRVAGFLTLPLLFVLAGTFLLPVMAQEAGETSEEQTQTFWWQVSVPGPSERSGHAMAYDSGRGVRVVFGGEGSSGPLGDTWECDSIRWRHVATSGPSPRRSHSMAYDSARGKVVLFGGYSDTDDPSRRYLNDTWEWNGSSWTQVGTDGPSGREGHAMAYDSARGVVVLFGGLSWQSSEGDQYLNDTWEYDGESNWRLVSTSGPPARLGHAMAYDSARGVVVLFGGAYREDNRWHYLNDTWEWDGSSWTQVSPFGQTPPARCRHAMAGDSGRGVVVMYGGYYSDIQLGSEYLSDLWEWEGKSWRQVSIEGPSARHCHAMAYDSAHGLTVLFGGYCLEEGGQYLNDMWVYGYEIDDRVHGDQVLRAGISRELEPEVIHSVAPDYPDQARAARLTGRVELQARINTRGEVVEISVLNESPFGYGFADKAIEAVSQWRYRPAIRNGRPTEVVIRFTLDFNLRY